MSEARVFQPPNNLMGLDENGGMLVSEALANGKQVMKDMRKPCLLTIDRLLAEIDERYGVAARTGDEGYDKLYQLCTRIIDVSAPVAELLIDRAAFSLCELVDRCEAQGGWDWPSVDVHIDAMKLLRNGGANLKPPERAHILGGLQKLVERLAPVTDLV